VHDGLFARHGLFGQQRFAARQVLLGARQFQFAHGDLRVVLHRLRGLLAHLSHRLRKICGGPLQGLARIGIVQSQQYLSGCDARRVAGEDFHDGAGNL
jgi:hypothetical protein